MRIQFSKNTFSVLALMRSLEEQFTVKQTEPSEEAQELFYDAMEASTEAARTALLEKVLKLDPGHVDALLVVLRDHFVLPGDEIELLRKIVALAERRLGRQAFEGFAGHFWGYFETRPYMRARLQLAEALHKSERFEEEIQELEGMLKLNPNDNQGLRYGLLACDLALKRLDRAAELFEKYDECRFNTVFAWGRVLERFLNGDLSGAQNALIQAREQNPHAELYISGHKRLPKRLPGVYAPSSSEEADCFAESLCLAWKGYPEALSWLSTQASISIKSKKSDVKRRGFRS